MAEMRRPVLTLVLLASVTFFLGLGRPAISDRDEAYYAEASREMVESGDWLTPHFNYEDRWQKPILYYWLTAAVYRITGPTEAAARFWSGLSGVGLVLLTFLIAREMGHSEQAAWLAAAITATCFGYLAEARQALPDLPLTFCVTLTIWMALRQRWPTAGVAAGLGFLMKGPVALVVPAVVVLPLWWRERSTLRIDWRGIALGILLVVAIGVPWYAAMTLAHGHAYLDSFFLGDNLERFTTSRFAGRTSSSWWFYGPILLGGLVPWTPLAVTMLVESIYRSSTSGRPEGRPLGRAAFTTEEWRLILWAAMPLLFFSLSLGKQPRYILSVLPPIAILIAAAVWRRIESPNVRQPALTVGTLATAALFALTALLLMRARPLFVSSYEPITTLGLTALLAWAGALIGLVVFKSWRRLPVAMALASATLLLAIQFGALSGARPEPVERMARLLRAYRVNSEPTGVCNVFVRNLVFYAESKLEGDLCGVDLSRAVAFLQSPDRVFLVASENDVVGLRATGITARELGRVHYVDASSIKLGTLLWPDPDRDIEAILLVTNK
jgi:4-amino-4-deoxy-L-arabinose transferase-like glycosyltransferase